MKFKDYDIPEDLLYTEDHEWARRSGDMTVVGITDYAAKTLNDVVYVSLPPEGQTLRQSDNFGTVESTKAVSELYSPVSGEVAKVNSALNLHPEIVNQSPYDEGWLLLIRHSDFEADAKKLLSASQYSELLSKTVKRP